MYLQCSKYTFLSNFTQTIYRWIYCIKKNCVADTKWVFVKVHCITLTKTCLIMPGDEGEMEKKKKKKQNLKQNWKTWKPTKQGGLPASIRPPQNIRSDLGAWLRTCRCRTQEGPGAEWQSTEHSPLSPKLVSHVSMLANKGIPLGLGQW